MLKFLAIVMLITSVGNVNAAGYTGNNLKEMMLEHEKIREGRSGGNPYLAGLYEGYIFGFTHGAVSVFIDNTIMWNNCDIDFCIPGSATKEQTIDIVSKFLKDHPEQLHENAVDLIMEAMKQAFPCKKRKP
jgi:Rap1a immunity proteins